MADAPHDMVVEYNLPILAHVCANNRAWTVTSLDLSHDPDIIWDAIIIAQIAINDNEFILHNLSFACATTRTNPARSRGGVRPRIRG